MKVALLGLGLIALAGVVGWCLAATLGWWGLPLGIVAGFLIGRGGRSLV